jgi:hypothetical protein
MTETDITPLCRGPAADLAATAPAGTAPAATAPAGTAPAGTGPTGAVPAGTDPAGAGPAAAGPARTRPARSQLRPTRPARPAPTTAGLTRLAPTKADRDRTACAARSGRSPGPVSARSPGLLTARNRPAGRRARPLASQPTARRPGSGSRRPGNGRARCQLLFTSLPRPPRRPRTGIRNRYQQTSAGHACRYGCGARIAHWSDVVKRVRGHLPPGHNMNTRRVNDRSGGRRGAQN